MGLQLYLTDNKVLIGFFHLLQLKRKEHEQLLTQLKRDYATQMSVLMSEQQTYGESSAQLISGRQIHSPRSGFSGPSGHRSVRYSSISPGSQNHSTLYSSAHQVLNTNIPSGGTNATPCSSSSDESFVNMGSSVPLLETCYPEAPQAAKTTRLWTQHDILQPASFPVGNCETLQGNVFHQVDNAGAISCDSSSSLQMTNSPNVRVSVQRGLTAITDAQRVPQNSSTFLPEAQAMPQQFTHGASLGASQDLTFYKHAQKSNPGQDKSTMDEHFMKSKNVLSERAQRVPCSNPDECPTGGKCYLFTET